MRIFFVLTLLIAQHQASAMDVQHVLEDFALTLNTARALQAGATTTFRCPAELKRLAGISRAIINASLPKADFTTENEQSYFLASPQKSGVRGGGFPVVTFFFDKAGNVERLNCSYSR